MRRFFTIAALVVALVGVTTSPASAATLVNYQPFAGAPGETNYIAEFYAPDSEVLLVYQNGDRPEGCNFFLYSGGSLISQYFLGAGEGMYLPVAAGATNVLFNQCPFHTSGYVNVYD